MEGRRRRRRRRCCCRCWCWFILNRIWKAAISSDEQNCISKLSTADAFAIGIAFSRNDQTTRMDFFRRMSNWRYENLLITALQSTFLIGMVSIKKGALLSLALYLRAQCCKIFWHLHGPSPASFSFIFVFSHKHYNFLQQINVENVHPV